MSCSVQMMAKLVAEMIDEGIPFNLRAGKDWAEMDHWPNHRMAFTVSADDKDPFELRIMTVDMRGAEKVINREKTNSVHEALTMILEFLDIAKEEEE